ncbi:MAG TPA: regulatory protein RecX [Blastocatellia bacterium]|nr:regulatory protein RecX [Blastocatellia bacterium]
MIEKITALAYKLLGAKSRSEKELRDRLLEKRWDESAAMQAAVDKVIARLKELRYIDDRLYAYDYAHSRVAVRPLGKARVARDLARKKVSRQVADEAMNLVFDETSEENLIDKAIERRVRIRGTPATREEAKKLFDHLLRLGFSYELVSSKVRRLSRNATDE